ncbi:MAG: SDR family NAD(P)-dependent oxidoreductase [SAR324 cluster bacterium]|nr:SDR family NAD(P)-dependent oxidoreductase [SAR324 cluster bacterium]
MTKEIKTVHLEKVIKNHTGDMTGKVIVITGTTSGTGFVCAREIARLGGSVVLLNRDSERSTSSYKKLTEEVSTGKFDPITCDLQDFDSVRKAIAEIKSRYEKIDVLCNNAAVMALKDQATKDGYDIQMQTNCISHFLLTKELFSLLMKSSEARVINHSSGARLGKPLEIKYFEKNGGNLGGNGNEKENSSFSGPRWERYHQTKLANCAFTYGLKQKLEQHHINNVKSLLAHPGLALTNLRFPTIETGGMETDSPIMENAQTAEDGALGIIRACCDEKAKSGDFFGPKGWTGFPELLPPEDLLLDPENIRINWEGCEMAVGEFVF